jgi:ribulose-5-phosphate 4-epimerase/fuculose-1-phosphate aldolase
MLDTICDVLKEAYSRGWITTRDGNASLRRRSQQWMYITPSGARKQSLTSEQVLKLLFNSNPTDTTRPWTDMERADDEYQRRTIGWKPSGELPMHYLLQTVSNTANRVVLHLHPTYTIAAMRRGIQLQSLVSDFPELSGFTKVGPNVGWVEPRTEELGRAVYSAFAPNGSGELSSDIVGIEGHGVVAVDIDPWKSFEHIERLEHICQIVLASGIF